MKGTRPPIDVIMTHRIVKKMPLSSKRNTLLETRLTIMALTCMDIDMWNLLFAMAYV